MHESLLEHGRDLLLRRGFGNISTRQIAAAAGARRDDPLLLSDERGPAGR